MRAEETKALGSSNSALGDADLVSGVFAARNGESLESNSRALEEEPNRNAEVQIVAEVLRMKAEETKALGSSNSASGDAELVSGVFVTVNGESLSSSGRRALTVILRFRLMQKCCA